MIRIIERASPRRRRWLEKYLSTTPVKWMTIPLRMGAAYHRAMLTGLGQTQTIFNRGKQSKRKGRKRVAEAAAIMIREKNHREKLTRYTNMLKQGKDLEMVVTVARYGKALVIMDGNHRAISAYRAGKRSLPIEYVDLRYPKCRCRP